MRLLGDLKVALESAGIDWDWDSMRVGISIAWRHVEPRLDAMHPTEVAGIVVSALHLSWVATISVVFWTDSNLKLLQKLAYDPRRALDAILSRRTQWEVETFCAKLNEIEQKLTEDK